MIKINLIREGKSPVKGAAAPGVAAAPAGTGAANANNFLVLGLLALGLLASGGYWFLRHSQLQAKQTEVAQKQEEAKKLDVIIKEVEQFEKRKDSLEKRIATINDLKKNQKGPVKLMDRVSQDLADLVWLDRMTLSKTQITIDGRGLNPNAIATFVENIKADPLFEEPDVSGVQASAAAPGQTVYTFSMSFAFKPAGLTENPAGDTQTTTTTSGTTTNTKS